MARLFAWFAHFYTSLGLVCAAIIAVLIVQGGDRSFRLAFLWMMIATAIDATDGWIAPFAPSVNLNLAGEWDLPYLRGFTLNGRVIYTGSQYIDTTWPRRSLPDWTRLDVGARYTFDNMTSPTGKPIALRFNVENVLDANYWMGGQAATFLTLGMPRTFRLALTTDF